MKVIAIDGPAASGKSSVSRRLANRLQCLCVNSGSMYRAVTWEILRQGIDPNAAVAVESALQSIHVGYEFGKNGESLVKVNSYVLDAELRESIVNSNVSAVSAIPAVRHLIVARLRDLALGKEIVMEGRDIGSIVFPDTPYKFYLDASPEVRRRRRASDGEADSIEQRDKQDSTRAEAPLMVAKGAAVIDTSELSLDEVVDKIFSLLGEVGK
jgi:cytidylate kinase